MKRPLFLLLVVIALVAQACSGDTISATNCDEIVDETMELFQRLIDDVDGELGDLTVADISADDRELPSLEAFAEDAATIDQLAEELGCAPTDVRAGVEARIGELSATTDLGRFIIDALRSGGL